MAPKRKPFWILLKPVALVGPDANHLLFDPLLQQTKNENTSSLNFL